MHGLAECAENDTEDDDGSSSVTSGSGPMAGSKDREIKPANMVDFSMIGCLEKSLSSVRITDETPPRFSAIDLAMVVCQKNRKRASEIIMNLQKAGSDFPGISGIWKFPGERQRNTPVVLAKQALELIMNLPGNMAKEYRVKMSDVVGRYLAGDSSMNTEIEKNASSKSILNEIFRAEIESSESANEGSSSLDDKSRADEIEPLGNQKKNRRFAMDDDSCDGDDDDDGQDVVLAKKRKVVDEYGEFGQWKALTEMTVKDRHAVMRLINDNSKIRMETDKQKFKHEYDVELLKATFKKEENKKKIEAEMKKVKLEVDAGTNKVKLEVDARKSEAEARKSEAEARKYEAEAQAKASLELKKLEIEFEREKLQFEREKLIAKKQVKSSSTDNTRKPGTMAVKARKVLGKNNRVLVDTFMANRGDGGDSRSIDRKMKQEYFNIYHTSPPTHSSGFGLYHPEEIAEIYDLACKM